MFILFGNATQIYAQAQVETARQYIAANIQRQKLAPADIDGLTLSSAYLSPTTGWYHIYFNQTYQNVEVYNRMMNVVLSNDQVAYMNHNFISSIERFAETGAKLYTITPLTALQKAMADVGIKTTNLAPIQELSATKLIDGTLSRVVYFLPELSSEKIDVKLYWLPVEKISKEESRVAKLALSWDVRFRTKDGKNSWNIHIDATSGEVLQKVDDVIHCSFGTPNHLQAPHACKGASQTSDVQYFGLKKASNAFTPNGYTVFDYPVESPSFGSRTESVNPYTKFAPSGTGPGLTNGWHNDGVTSYSITRGNNVWAQEDVNRDNETGASPSSATLDFNYPYTAGPNTAAGNQNAAITNLFYWNNLIHDVLWKYGFDEPSGNFQTNNMGRGGIGNDFVYADAQDGGGSNNATFDTQPDGVNGRMQMFLWTSANQPDGDFDNGIISHEYGHGWSIRLAGGPATTSCLNNTEQGGEGWSDYLALMLTTNWGSLSPTLASANIPRGIGTYAIGEPTTGLGIRPYHYSYDMTNVNGAVTYGKVNDAHATTFPRPHGIGSIWATMLWDMTWAIIMQDNYIEPNIYTTPSSVSAMRGNVAALKLVNEGLRLQPCSPSFVQARDAILQADRMLFGGRYQCAIGQAFARRGLGGNASTGASSNDRVVTEDFSPINGFGLTSSITATSCSGTLFSYTATSNSTATSSFRWNRPVVAGISNPGATADVALINETLVNTTTSPITVPYSFTVSTSSAPCSGSPASDTQVINVVVNPALTPTVGSYSICQNASVPAGEGLVAPTIMVNTFSGELTSGSPTYVRNADGDNRTVYTSGGRTVYYQSFSFTAPTSGTQTFEIISSSLIDEDPFLSLYQTAFDPASPATNFLHSDDDSGEGRFSRFTHNLTAGTTYIVVVASFETGITGGFTFRLSLPIFLNSPNWYATSSGGSPITSGNVFNPVGHAGSDIPNTATPGTTVFYVSTPSLDACRTATTFTILNNAAPTPSGNTTIIAGNTVSLTATGCSDAGSVLRWYQTSNNVEVSMPVSPTITTQYYVRCQQGPGAGGCLSAPSANVTVTVTAAITQQPPSSSAVCVGATVTASVSVSGTNPTYQWYKDGTSLGVAQQSATLTLPNVTTAQAGSYSVVITSNASSVTSTVFSLTVNALPTASLMASGTLTCAQTSVTLTAGGGSSFVFSGPGVVGQNATSGTALVNASGTYSVTVTTSGGCTSSTTVAVGQNTSSPLVSISPSSTTLTCTTSSVSLSAIGSGTYRWNTGVITPIISVTTADTYSVTLTGINGCTSTASSTISQDQNAPSLSISPASATLNCASRVGSLSAIGAGSVRWNTGATTSSISVSVAGTYSVTLTGGNGCSTTASASVSYQNCGPTLVTVIPPQSATIGDMFTYTIPATTFTDPETPNSLTLVVSGLPAGLSFVSPNTITGTPSTTVGSPFSVTVTAIDPGGLSASTSFSLTVQPRSFAITGVTMLDCNHISYYERRINFTVSFEATNGQPISLSAVNEARTVAIHEPYQLNLFTDNPVIVFKARQQGTPGEATFSYNWLAFCANGNPRVENAIPPQSATVGQAFSYTIPATTFTDAETASSLTLSVVGLPAGLSFVAPATIAGIVSASASAFYSVTVTASDPAGGSVSTILPLGVVSPGGCGSMFTLKAGDWNDPAVWSCGRLPLLTDAVTLNHAVSLPSTYQGQALRVIYNATGRLIFGSISRLRLGGN
ncbi:M36 family metallopeptidase [Spirosoma profusum]|uniref:M36 family metallopeptidase n=1 Tax=Spirosoma profusum TaxID=2771354 RepID=UPI001CC25DD4|nr:M36 family metallopeptidase [Spirosoma profusum]